MVIPRSLQDRLRPEHPSAVVKLEHIGGLYCEQGDYRQALEYLKPALSIRVNLLGELQPLTGRAAMNVASLLMKLNKRQEAYELVLNFLPKVPTQGPVHEYFQLLEAQLLSSTIRKGFRQPPKSGKGKTRNVDNPVTLPARRSM